MQKLIIFIIITLQIAFSLCSKGEAPKCCENEKNLLIDFKCDENSLGKHPKIALECEHRYVLDPSSLDEDTYEVTANGSLYIPDMKSYLFADEFCIVNSYDEELNETNEIAIVCFPEEEIAQIASPIKATLLSVSIFFLLLTLLIYYRLKELRETQDKVMIYTLICLMSFMFFLTCLQVYVPENDEIDLCLYMAFPTYFFTIAYFSWLNCVILNVWKIIVLRRWKVSEFKWYALNHVYAWSIPVVMTAIVIGKHYIKPTFGVTSCWFYHPHDQWTLVYLPISIMLGLNVIFCIWSSVCLTYKDDYTPDTLKVLRYKCFLYVKIFLLGGVTWIFEILSYSFNNHSPSAWVWIIVDSINCLHGVLIFCVLILWRQRIRKELANHKILCFTCPSRWADINDEEEVCLDNEGKTKYDLIVKAIN